MRTLLASACLLACLFAPLAPFAHGQAQPPVDDEEELDEEALDEELDAEEEADEEAPPQLGTNPYVQEEDADEAVEVVGACQGRRIIRIMVEGMQRVTAEDILAGMRLGRDMPCSDVEVTRDARALWELGFFDDIVIEAEPVGAGVVLVVRVRERPEIRHIVFEGNDEVDDDDLTEEITLRERQILSASEVRAQVAKIRDHYASEGFFLARITHEVLRVDGDTNEVDVVFRIDEGPEVKVRRITIVGNDNISTSDLHGIMATGETGFFSFISSNNTFDREKFDEDMVRLQAWYYDQGYLAMAVGSARVELTSTTRSSSRSSRAARPAMPTVGTSMARVQPAIGNDSGPSLPGPNRFNTFRNELQPASDSRVMIHRRSSVASRGRAHCHCRKPDRPYTRFQWWTMSRGWKNWLMVCRWSRWRTGALRYQASLKTRMVAGLTRRTEGRAGQVARVPELNRRGSRRRRPSSWSSRAKPPRLRIDRPMARPLVMMSIHATE